MMVKLKNIGFNDGPGSERIPLIEILNTENSKNDSYEKSVNLFMNWLISNSGCSLSNLYSH